MERLKFCSGVVVVVVADEAVVVVWRLAVKFTNMGKRHWPGGLTGRSPHSAKFARSL